MNLISMLLCDTECERREIKFDKFYMKILATLFFQRSLSVA